MKHTLEEHKIFPIVAWVAVIGFAVFTYTLANNLRETSGELSLHASLTQKMLHDTK